MSLKNTIYEYIKSQYPKVVHKGEIGRKAVLEWGYENENAGRRCRELEEAGLIAKVSHPKREAQYVYNPAKYYKIEYACCYSLTKFGVHTIDCKTKVPVPVKVTQSLF